MTDFRDRYPCSELTGWHTSLWIKLFSVLPQCNTALQNYVIVSRMMSTARYIRRPLSWGPLHWTPSVFCSSDHTPSFCNHFNVVYDFSVYRASSGSELLLRSACLPISKIYISFWYRSKIQTWIWQGLWQPFHMQFANHKRYLLVPGNGRHKTRRGPPALFNHNSLLDNIANSLTLCRATLSFCR